MTASQVQFSARVAALICCLGLVLLDSSLVGANEFPAYGGTLPDDPDYTGNNGAAESVIVSSIANDAYLPLFEMDLSREYYALKNKPANLTCRARNADNLQIYCNGELVKRNVTVTRIPLPSQSSSASAGAGQLDYALEASALITCDEVSELFDEFSCHCVASRNGSALTLPPEVDPSGPTPTSADRQLLSDVKSEVKSTKAIVANAKLEKNFYQEPIDTVTDLDLPILLHCRAPEGKPAPQIFWLRDGRQIDPQADTNFVVANDGSLILSHAREFDSGSYVCVATNIVGTRRTQPAKVVVVVNGGWSAWTTWQACSKKCGPGFQRRSRECTQPRPRNGGSDCQGPTEEKRNCTGLKCPTSGIKPAVEEWLDWSEWSECNKCQQTRRRLCRDEFGKPCINRSEEVQSQACCPQFRIDAQQQQTSEKTDETKQLILYISVPLGAVVLLAIGGVILLVIIRRMRQRSRIRLYGVSDGDSTRCLKFRKNGANKSAHGEPISSRYDIGMTATAQLINGIDNADMRFAPNGTPTMHESHFQSEPHFTFCSTRADAQQPAAIPAVAFNSQAEGTMAGAPYFAVPFVGTQQQQQVATTNLSNRLDQPALPVLLNGSANKSQTDTAFSSPMPFAVNGGKLSFSSTQSTVYSPPSSISYSNPAASTFNVIPNNNNGLHDSPETNIVSVNSSMRLPPSIAIPPPPPPTSARQFQPKTGFTLSLRPSVHGQPELTLAGGSCHDTFPRSCESRTDVTFSELSSVHSETDDAEMSELCDTQIQLLRATDFSNTPTRTGDLDRIGSPALIGCASVDRPEGCILSIERANISLTVPEFAFDVNKIDISINVLRSETERPKLNSRETLLSPIVQIDSTYADARFVLSKSCVLSIPHCAVLAGGDRQCNWRFSVYRSDNIDTREDFNDWKPIVTIDQDGTIVSCNASISCHVDAHSCHIVTSKFGKYCLVGESAPQCTAVKSLRLAAFARNLSNSIDHNVRLYAIEDHPDALDAVVEIESRLNSHLLDSPKRLLFVDSGDNLCLSVEHINSNWKSRTTGCYQEIPFHHIWNSHGKLHCSFSFECCSRSSASEHFQCTVAVCQKNALAAREHLDIVQFSKGKSHSTSTSERVIPSSQAIIHTPNNSNTSGIASCSCIVDSVAQSHCAVAKQSRLLCPETRAKLCSILDECDGYRADWRILGQHLGVQQGVINMAASSISPTATLLTLFEAQARNNEQAIQTLYTLMRSLGRHDCAAVVETELLAQVNRSMVC